MFEFVQKGDMIFWPLKVSFSGNWLNEGGLFKKIYEIPEKNVCLMFLVGDILFCFIGYSWVI